jgi:hypothetical protein
LNYLEFPDSCLEGNKAHEAHAQFPHLPSTTPSTAKGLENAKVVREKWPAPKQGKQTGDCKKENPVVHPRVELFGISE